MELDTEEAVKTALGLTSFVNMSNEKMLELSILLPNISEDVQIALLEHIPEFRQFALTATAELGNTLLSSLDANAQSQKRLYDILDGVQQTLAGRIAQENNSHEQQQWLVQKMEENRDAAFALHTGDQMFIADESRSERRTRAISGWMPLVSLVVVTGARIWISRGAPRT